MVNESRYKEITKNVLKGVRVTTGWDTPPYEGASVPTGWNYHASHWNGSVPIYDSQIPHIVVPGVLEFSGIKEPIKDILDAGLTIYHLGLEGGVEYCGESLEEDFFPGISQEARLELMRAADSRLLGLASVTLSYLHQGIMCLRGKCGIETNGLSNMHFRVRDLERNPFSPELTRQILPAARGKRDRQWMLAKKDIEIRGLRELAKRVNEGFSPGKYKEWEHRKL